MLGITKIWPLLIAAGAAATAAGVTVWAASATRAPSIELSPQGSPGSPAFVSRDDSTGTADASGTDMAGNAADVPGAGTIETALRNPDPCTAIRYAHALQEGRTDEVIRKTHWMQERLKRVRLGSDMPEDLDIASEELRHDILTRTLEENRLRPEGVDDKYIFAPGARIELIGADRREGQHEDPLARPVRERRWLRVEYPEPGAALRDESGRPIRSIVVGVDISIDGHVLKAGVLGNVEINRNAISLDWGQ